MNSDDPGAFREMTAAEFIEALPHSRTPAGRMDLVMRGVKAGLISAAQGRKLLDFDDSEFKERPSHLRLVPPPES